MNQVQWSQQNKAALRDLYAMYLEDTGVTLDDFLAGRCVSYVEFQDKLFAETVHA